LSHPVYPTISPAIEEVESRTEFLLLKPNIWRIILPIAISLLKYLSVASVLTLVLSGLYVFILQAGTCLSSSFFAKKELHLYLVSTFFTAKAGVCSSGFKTLDNKNHDLEHCANGLRPSAPRNFTGV